MRVFDEVTKKLVDINSCQLVVVDHLPGQVILAYYNNKWDGNIVPALFKDSDDFSTYMCDLDKMRDKLFYSKSRGTYISYIGVSKESVFTEKYKMGYGMFPYRFQRKYEAIENFKIFDGKQVIIKPKEKHPLSKYLKYSFGLEFETSMGYIPEDICFRDGLIPLRDGSISGIEYSTIILRGNEGLSLLKQQLDSLKEYTAFNKECSLHVHFGEFPLVPKKIFNLYLLCKLLEIDTGFLVPCQTFETSKYKNNGKDYCNRLGNYRNFDQMYEHLVGRKFFGDLTQPHPNDIRREAKWRINTRYYSVNFINMLCYNVNKTVEFRFLRPTYNHKKILLWLYIFNAILQVAENMEDSNYLPDSIEEVLRIVYPEKVFTVLLEGLYRLRILTSNQYNNGDLCGRDIVFEDELFPNSLKYLNNTYYEVY